MACKVTMTLLQESQQGNIGDDWKYSIEAKVFSQGLKGTGHIKVPKHTLSSGATQEPPGPPKPVVIDAGDGGGEIMIRITLLATEVDFFKSDSGETQINFHMPAPSPGDAPISRETTVSVGVRESPGIMDETAVLTLTLRLVASCD